MWSRSSTSSSLRAVSSRRRLAARRRAASAPLIRKSALMYLRPAGSQAASAVPFGRRLKVDDRNCDMHSSVQQVLLLCMPALTRAHLQCIASELCGGYVVGHLRAIPGSVAGSLSSGWVAPQRMQMPRMKPGCGGQLAPSSPEAAAAIPHLPWGAASAFRMLLPSDASCAAAASGVVSGGCCC